VVLLLLVLLLVLKLLLVLVLVLLRVLLHVLLVVLIVVLFLVMLLLVLLLMLLMLLWVLLLLLLLLLLWTQCSSIGKRRNGGIFQRRKWVYFVQQIEVWFVFLNHGKFLVCLWQPTHVLLKMRFPAEKEL
jgi:hypothetical protein